MLPPGPCPTWLHLSHFSPLSTFIFSLINKKYEGPWALPGEEVHEVGLHADDALHGVVQALERQRMPKHR